LKVASKSGVLMNFDVCGVLTQRLRWLIEIWVLVLMLFVWKTGFYFYLKFENHWCFKN